MTKNLKNILTPEVLEESYKRLGSFIKMANELNVYSDTIKIYMNKLNIKYSTTKIKTSKNITFEIASKIRQKYINRERYYDLLDEYNIPSESLKNILANRSFIDKNYIKPPHNDSNQKITKEEFIERANIIHENFYDYSKVRYINLITKVIIICKKEGHGEFSQKPHSHLIKRGCRKCSYKLKGDKFRSSNKELDKTLLDNKVPILRLGEYTTARSKIEVKCLKCEYLWQARPYILTKKNGSGCPKCSIRTNEKIVMNFLENNNIKYEKSMIKINNKKYFPDFILNNMNLIVEYNGLQHYQPVMFGSMSSEDADEQLIYQKNRDQNLRDYCYKENIHLLEIDGRKYQNKKLIMFLENYFLGCENDIY